MYINIEINGKINPIGVSAKEIGLSVKTEGIVVDKIDYKIAKSQKDLSDGNAIAFVSAKDCRRVIINDLEDTTKYYCLATVFCGEKVYEQTAYFETGISQENFTAKWIQNPNYDGSVAQIKKSFIVDGNVESARLYIVGLGFYKSYINDKETDEFYFKPVLTDFDIREGLKNKNYNEDNYRDSRKTVCYDTFDVTDKLVKGENQISVLLGTGWYCNEDKLITDPSFNYGKPKLIFELRIKTKDGTIKVVSNEDCVVRNTNIKSQLFECDHIDFTKPEMNFIPVVLAQAPRAELIPNMSDNDKIFEVIKPVSICEKDGVIEYDFAKNHTGGLRFTVKGARGSKLIIKQYETKKDGKLDPLTSRWDAYKDGKYLIGHLDQECEYILSGGEDYVEPYFHWSSYRYATIECDAPFEINDVVSLFITTDMDKDSHFECSDQFLNRLNEVFILTQRDNMHCAVPSDCPHREKLPYTGDGQIACETVLYALDAENFYRKWVQDIFDAQGKNGFVPYTAPHICGGGGMWWSNALCVVPLVLYGFTGDRSIIEKALPHCIKLVEYYNTRHDGDYINNGCDLSWCLGDWLTPEVTVLDKSYMNTLAWYCAIDNTLKMCEILDDNSQVVRLQDLKEKVKSAINEKYFDPTTCNYADGIQGANILPAINGVADKQTAEKILAKLVEKYQSDPHFDTGIVLTPKLLDALTLAGRADIALNVLTEKTGPSYYDMLKGETTLPEHWFKHWPGSPNSYVSHNHPMFGSVLCWVYKNVAGLDLTNLYKNQIVYSPKVIRQISSAKMSKQTSFGRASVEYFVENDFNMNIVVPFGISGLVKLPKYVKEIIVDDKAIEVYFEDGYSVFTVSGGTHVIKGKIA